MDAIWIYAVVIGAVAGAHLGLFFVLRHLMHSDRRRRDREPTVPPT